MTERSDDELLRSPLAILLAGVIAAALCLVPAIPAVRAVLRVGPLDVAIALGLFCAMMIAGAILYRAKPSSRAYDIFDRVETAVIQVAMLSLVFASGRGDSFFWLLAIVHMMIVGRHSRFPGYNLGVFSTGPVLLAAVFAIVERDLGAAVLCLVIGGLGVYVFWLSLTGSRQLAATDAERQRLAAELADTRVREERERIAREIHDGLGADLAALDWRLRGLGKAGALKNEVDELVGRLGQGNAELRTIVWALRTPSRTWRELVVYIRQRATELCGDAIALELVDDGGAEINCTGEVALDYMRSVLEMVRNAVRHAAPTRIRVVLHTSGNELAATVEDDGRGLPAGTLSRTEGGLANLRHRITRAGGELVASTPQTGGTRFSLDLPLPATN